MRGAARTAIRSALGEYPRRICDSAEFDGTNDMMTRGANLDGVADSKQGSLSAWFRPGPNYLIQNRSILQSTNQRIAISQGSVVGSDAFRVEGRNAAGTLIMNVRAQVNIYGNDGQWYHVLACWDLATGASGLYFNDVLDHVQLTFTNDTIDYTDGDIACGGLPATGSNRMEGCLAEIWFAPGVFIDFGVPANRRKFRTAAGRPADLGSDGSRPTGTPPAIYFRLNDGEAVANFATNRGTGGNFGITGALATGSNSPSD